MITLSKTAADEGTYVITCTFTDADGSAVTPNTLTWDLTDSARATINSRTAVSVSPSTSVDIVLSGDDLDYSDGVERIFSIEGDYDSSTYGSSLPIKEQAKFNIGQWT